MDLILLITIGLACLVAYWPSLTAELTFDDHSVMDALDDHLRPL